MQFMERLSDRQVAQAVKARIDWKYLLALPMDDRGFDHSVLSEFRDRLLKGDAEALLLDAMLMKFREAGLLKMR
ncbi:MAG: transposase, partial [Chloroflexota bacterium]